MADASDDCEAIDEQVTRVIGQEDTAQVSDDGKRTNICVKKSTIRILNTLKLSETESLEKVIMRLVSDNAEAKVIIESDKVKKTKKKEGAKCRQCKN